MSSVFKRLSLSAFTLVVGWGVLYGPSDASAQSRRAQQKEAQDKREQEVVPEQHTQKKLLPYENPFSRELDAQEQTVEAEERRLPQGEEAVLMKTISEIYRLHLDAMQAQLEGDQLAAETKITEAIDGVQKMLETWSDIQSDRRFAELYRTVMAEYQLFYGISASEGQVSGEVFAVMEELFSEDDLEPLETISLPSNLTLTKTSVPLIQNSHVNRHLMYYAMRRPDVMELWLQRSRTWFPMMERIFKEEGVPLELIHLSMIESGLNPTARSWASAVGMWQFIRATGSMYGLEVNFWVDERQDPEKSTRAAARHLRDLYNIWNDWHLAMANYNISPRGLNRAINAAGGQKDYWKAYPYLPRETRGYVPGFIAATMIAMNPEEFGFQREYAGEPYRYDLAEVGGLLPLEALADAAGITVTDLKQLNPELLRWATPPGDSYPLKIPYGSRERFLQAYEAMPKEPVADQLAVHEVRRGETLGIIARKYGTTVRALYDSNQNLSSLIHPGQKIIVPVAPSAFGRIEADRPSNQPVALAPTVQRTSSQPQAPANSSLVTYVVKPNDTVGHIAEWYDVQSWQIRSWNGIGNTIRVGQKIKIYVPKSRVTYYAQVNQWSFAKKQAVEASQGRGEDIFTGATASASASASSGGGSAGGSESAGSTDITYTVRRSDTLTQIAQSFGVSISSIQEANNLRGTVIYPGQVLTIRR